MTKLIYIMVIAVMSLASNVAAQVRVVASTTDLASIAMIVGGDNVKVEAIAQGNMDPHFIQILPSYMVKVSRADIYLKVGLDTDLWADQIIDGANNSKLDIIDCSVNIEPLQVPRTAVNRSQGDIHPRGNPHYWLDPANGIVIATTIVEHLKNVDPGNAAAYDAGLAHFKQMLAQKMTEWETSAANLRGKEIITFHNTWPYFEQAFGVEVAGFCEPYPGVPPSPSHTANIIELVSDRNIKVVARAPFYSDRTPNSIARETSAVSIVIPASVRGVKEASDYFALFDVLIERLSDALGE